MPIDTSGTEEDEDQSAQDEIDAQKTRIASPQQSRAENFDARGKTTYKKGKQVQASAPSYQTVGATKAQWMTMTPTERAKWGQHLLAMGIITAAQATDPSTLAKYWSAYAEEAGASFAAGNKKASPYSVSLADGEVIKLLGGVDGGTGGSGGIPDGDQTTTSTSFDITNPAEAASKIQDVFRAAFGREAAPGELSQLAASLQEAEYANPVNTDQVTTYAGGNAVAQKTTSTGGLDSTYYLTQKAKSAPEYGAYQAATTYANELFKAIASPV
jgi:hypothetical protein